MDTFVHASVVPRPVRLAVSFDGDSCPLRGLEASERTMRYRAMESGMGVSYVGYWLAPEHRFPAAVQDAWAAWLGHEPVKQALTARSTSAWWSAGNPQEAISPRSRRCTRRTRAGLFTCRVLVYPAVGPQLRAPSLSEFAEGYLISAADV
jgi:acetyl esterase